MRTPAGKIKKTGFTKADKKTLSGLSGKVAKKHKCSGMYVRHIINGTRETKSVLAKNIIKDLKAFLRLLHPNG